MRVPRAIIGDNSSLAGNFLPRVIPGLTRPWILGLLWLLVIAYAVRFALFKLPAPPAFTDFNHYYTAALSLRRGSNPYVTSFEALGRSLGLSLSDLNTENQPPTLLLCFEPLTRLSPYTAYWIWVSITLASLIIAVCLLVGGETSLGTRQAYLFGALLFLYPPVYEHFYFANMQIAITLMIVAAMYCMGRGADRAAGLWLALAMALKAYPALLAFYLVCRRRWRTLLWMVIWAGVLGLLTLWRVGWVSFSFLDTFGVTTSRRFLQNPGFFSIDATVSHMFWHGNLPLATAADAVRRVSIVAVELAVFALTVSATASAAPDRGWRAFSLWIPAMLLLSPIAEPHYLVLLVVPFAAVADAAALGEAAPWVIHSAIASYLIAFSRYPLTLIRHLSLGSAAFFRIANQFWFFAVAIMYLATYGLATSARKSARDETFFARAKSAAPDAG
jgi:Glycosyltransferase family 87